VSIVTLAANVVQLDDRHRAGSMAITTTGHGEDGFVHDVHRLHLNIGKSFLDFHANNRRGVVKLPVVGGASG